MLKLVCLYSFLLLFCGCHFELFKARQDPFYATVLGADRNNPAALYAQGKLLLNQGRYQQSEAYFTHLLEIEPQHATGWDALGQARLEQGNFKEAQVAFEHELAIRKGSAGELGLAEAKLMQGNVTDAQALAQTNSQEFGASAGLARLQGDIAFRERDYAKAQESYQQSLKLNPDQAGLAGRMKDLADYLEK